MRILLFLLSIIIHAAYALNPPLPQLQTNGSYIVESATGNVILLRGVNMAAKVSPFEFVNVSSALDVQRVTNPLVSQGFNVVRLAFIWDIFEPTPGNYNWTYIQHYKQFIHILNDVGIYTMVDFHQDGFSRFSLGGCGEGFPQFVIPAGNQSTPVNQSDIYEISMNGCIGWGIKQRMDVLEVGRERGTQSFLFTSLITPGNPIRLAFINMLKVVGAYLSDGGVVGIVGFDILNEPVVVSSSFYNEAISTIKASGFENALFFVEPTIQVSKTDFLALPSNLTNVVFTPHYYPLSATLDQLMQQITFFVNNGLDPWNATKTCLTIGYAMNALQTGILLAAQEGTSVSLINELHGLLSSTFAVASTPCQNPSTLITSPAQTAAIILALQTAFNAPQIGLLALLQALLTNIHPYVSTDIVGLYKLSQSANIPMLLGEFGIEREGKYIDPATYTTSIYDALDYLFVGSTQWAYLPQWTLELKDGWNLEDFSIYNPITNQWNKNFVPNRPYPKITAGIPMSLSFASVPVFKLSYTYKARGGSGVTEIVFNRKDECPGGKGKVDVSTDKVSCVFGDFIIHCTSMVDIEVTITAFCIA
ncbi:UNVERIFIED_CONTAM: hypothetical protein HDU68_001383 [Siphonaria sp. JEL0065]|nr:hypothetical protein HDU68_001383 [Siphonaria sp. JEL0065]